MSGILYHHFFSPPSRVALLAVRNLGLTNIQVKIVDIYKGEQHSSEYLKVNPLNQVPAYVEGDFVLTESKAIATYLANSSKSPLYPTDCKQRALIDSKLHFESCTAFPAVRNFLRPVLRSGLKKVDPQVRDEIKITMGKLNGFLENSHWFCGSELSLADVAFLSSVGTIKFMNVNFDEFPKVKEWYNRCKSLPGFDENEEGAFAIVAKVAAALEEPLWPKH